MLDLDTIGYFLYMEDREKQAAIQQELNEQAALLDAGVITQEVFDEKKRQLRQCQEKCVSFLRPKLRILKF